MSWRLAPLLLLLLNCSSAGKKNEGRLTRPVRKIEDLQSPVKAAAGSWPAFLQNLQVIDAPVLDYTGKPVRAQFKSSGVIPFDVGTKDLQQCADALMRLRAEYLFEQHRSDEIAFHFVSGQLYRFSDYCTGLRPVPSGGQVVFRQGTASQASHASLRKYLDLVYTYASTISLAKELKPVDSFGIGTVVIYPGSPGHCFIIVDEKVEGEEKRFRLAEGYTPAQSIYILQSDDGTPWHRLRKGAISTASYDFSRYQLGVFE